MPEKISFVLNGNIKKRHRLKAELETLLGSNYKLDWQETQSTGDGIRIAREAAISGAKYIVAVGGDGTVNEMVNGIMQAGTEAQERIIACVIPRGTGNDFARTLQSAHKLAGFKDQLETGKTRLLDIGEVHHQGVSGKPETRFYNNITDIGIGGDVAMKMSSISKMMGGSLAYITAIFKSFISFRHKNIKVTCPEYQFEGKALSLVMANCSTFGSGLIIAPQAQPDDGMIQLVLLAEVTVMDYIKNLARVKKGKVLNHPQIFYHSVSKVEITTGSDLVPIDMDGEFIGFTPIQVKLRPRAMTFLVG